jgi:hypothetical protein
MAMLFVLLLCFVLPAFALDRAKAPPELAADWLRALQEGRDARHFPRPTSAPKQATAKAATPAIRPELQLIDALDRADHSAFKTAWARLEANWQLQQAAFDQTERTLVAGSAAAIFLQRHSESRAHAANRWQALQAAVQPLLDANATKGAALSSDLRRLIGERLSERDAPSQLGFRQLPVRHLQSSAPPLPNVPLFTPDYLRASDNCANFDTPTSAPGPEAAITPEILAKATELGFEYTRIFDFVRTQILTEWYPGSQRGALGTLRAGRGNDVDQASLLIALLRASGVRAAYVHGRIEVSAATLTDMLGNALTPIPDLLHRAQRSHEPIYWPGFAGPQLYQIDYTWVVARLPWDDYRGSAAEQQRGLTCLPLDTALKQHAVSGQQGLLEAMQFDTTAFQQTYLSTPQSAQPLSLILAQAEAHLAATGSSTLADWLVDRSITEPVQGLIPPTLPFATLGAIAVSESLPPQLQTKVTLSISASGIPTLNAEVPTHEALSGRLSLSFLPASWADQDLIASFGGLSATPAYLIRLRPQLSLNGRALALGEPLTPGDRVTLAVSQGSGAHEVTVEQSIMVGAMAAIVLAQDGAPPPAETQAAALDSEPEAARLLSNLGRHYLGRWNDDAHTIAQLAGTTVVQALPSVAFVLSQLDVERVEGIPLTLSLDSIGLDAALRVAAPVSGVVSAGEDCIRLVALQGSALEREVFDQQWATPAISAERLIAEAHQLGMPILDLQGAAAAAQVQTLSHSEAVRTAVIDWLLGGYRAQIPESPLQIGAWQGSGWLVSDEQGSSGYFLSGGLAGGITVLPPDQWYLEDLAAALADPYAQAPNQDPLSALVVKLDASAQDQQAQHGDELPQPLGVRIEDGAGRPVLGAQVSFSLTTGEGSLVSGSEAGQVLVVATDRSGLASVRLQLGASSPLEAILHLEGQTYPQRARLFKVDVSVASAVSGGSIAAGDSYRAYGMPGPPAELRLTAVPPNDAQGALFHPPGIGYLAYRMIVADANGHIVANAPVNIATDWTPGLQLPPGTNCSIDPLTGALPAGVFLPGECPANQLILTGHQCVGQTREFISRPYESGFNIVPPNVVSANVGVQISTSGVATRNLGFATSGTMVVIPESGVCRVSHGPWQSIFAHSVHDVIGAGRLDDQVIYTQTGSDFAGVPLTALKSMEAGIPGERLPLPRTMYFAQRPVYGDLLANGGMVASWNMGGPSVLPESLDDPPIAISPADIDLQFDNGGTAEDLRNIAPGVWQYQLRLPPQPARIRGSLQAHAPATPEMPFATTVRAVLPEAWALLPSVGEVQPSPVPQSLAGTTASELGITLALDPPEYLGSQVDLMLQEDAQPLLQISSPYSYDGFFAILNRGVPIDVSRSYSAQARINVGTPFELSTVPVPVAIQSDVIAGLTTYDGAADAISEGELLALALGPQQRELKLLRQIDVANQRVCAEGGEIVFFLAQAATVYLDLFPIDVNGVSGAVAATLLSTQSLPAGLHRVPVPPATVPFGRFWRPVRNRVRRSDSPARSPRSPRAGPHDRAHGRSVRRPVRALAQ